MLTENQLNDLLTQRIYDPIRQPGKEEIIFTVEDKTVGTLQNFIVFAGLPKAGKSTFIGACIASAFTPFDVFTMKLKAPEGRPIIAYFDTESSDYDFYRQMDKIKGFSNLETLPDHFAAFAVREDGAEAIMQMIEFFLKANPECAILIVDGFLDLLNNYNDEVESKQLINWIKRITKVYNCLLITVLHNGKNSQNTVGHSGSMSDRYAQSTLEIVKDREAKTYTLSPKFLRSSGDFTPVELINIDGKWMQSFAEPKPQGKKVISDIDHKRNLINIFLQSDEYVYKDLVTELSEVYAIGTTNAKKLLTTLKEKQLIVKQGESYKRGF